MSDPLPHKLQPCCLWYACAVAGDASLLDTHAALYVVLTIVYVCVSVGRPYSKHHKHPSPITINMQFTWIHISSACS